MTQKLIIDVSEHQAKLNWEALKPNIDGAIIRCGYGDDDKSQDDLYWSYNVKECERLNIPYGVYLYSYADTTAHVNSEIAHVLRLLKGHKPQYPVYIDLEESRYGGIAKKAADAFCKAVKAAGYVPGVYTYESFYNAYMGGWKAYTLWVAKYGVNDGKPHDKPSIGVNYDAWQYSSNVKISGYDGRLDASYFYRTWTDEEPAQETSTASADKVLEIAKSQIGVTNGSKYGKWYEQNVDKDARNYDFGGAGVPWCAMFASWCFSKAGAKCAGLPGAYCPTMLQAARDAGRVVSASKARPGDVVYFDWDGGECDHVGIVTENHASDGYMMTVEGNTDNGVVAIKKRIYSCIAGVVRPYFGSSQIEPSTPSKPVVFRLSTHKAGKRWLKAGREHGTKNWRIRWIAIKGCGRYRVYTKANGWLDWVDKYDISNLEYGCAGDGSPIFAVQVENGACKYAARIGSTWLDDMIGLHDTGGSSDNFAGDMKHGINGFRIEKIG